MDSNLILLPALETQRISQKNGPKPRVIPASVVRTLHAIGHFGLRMHLKSAQRYAPHCSTLIVNEHHTSMTCGGCGRVTKKLGGSRVYRCRQEGCGFICPRDSNSCRLILFLAAIEADAREAAAKDAADEAAAAAAEAAEAAAMGGAAAAPTHH